MGRNSYAVIDGITKKMKVNYAVIGGVTRKITKLYGVVGGVTKLIWEPDSDFVINYVGKGILYIDGESYYSTSRGTFQAINDDGTLGDIICRVPLADEDDNNLPSIGTICESGQFAVTLRSDVRTGSYYTKDNTLWTYDSTSLFKTVFSTYDFYTDINSYTTLYDFCSPITTTPSYILYYCLSDNGDKLYLIASYLDMTNYIWRADMLIYKVDESGLTYEQSINKFCYENVNNHSGATVKSIINTSSNGVKRLQCSRDGSIIAVSYEVNYTVKNYSDERNMQNVLLFSKNADGTYSKFFEQHMVNIKGDDAENDEYSYSFEYDNFASCIYLTPDGKYFLIADDGSREVVDVYCINGTSYTNIGRIHEMLGQNNNGFVLTYSLFQIKTNINYFKEDGISIIDCKINGGTTIYRYALTESSVTYLGYISLTSLLGSSSCSFLDRSNDCNYGIINKGAEPTYYCAISKDENHLITGYSEIAVINPDWEDIYYDSYWCNARFIGM